MERSAITVVLLPNAKDSKQLVACSTALGRQHDSLIALGPSALPHVTVAQFYAPESAALELWKQVSHLPAKVTELRSTAFCYFPESNRRMTWIELGFLKTVAVNELHTAVLQTEFARTHEIRSRRGDEFRPHCTLGLAEGKGTFPFDLAPYDIFGRAFTDVTLSVGVNGDDFTYSRALFPERR